MVGREGLWEATIDSCSYPDWISDGSCAGRVKAIAKLSLTRHPRLWGQGSGMTPRWGFLPEAIGDAREQFKSRYV